MRGVNRRCPLCGTPLPAGKYEQVMREHAKLREHLETDARRAASAELRDKSSTLRKQQAELERIKAKQATYEKRLNRRAEQMYRLSQENRRLREQIKRGTTPQVEGLLEESKLIAYLRSLFPDDEYKHTGKGGDIIHTVKVGRQVAGVIVYECKKCSRFERRFIRQTAIAGKQRGANYALLVTNVLPKRNTFFYVERDVIVLSPAGLHPVVHTARQSLITIHRLRATDAQRNKAVRAVYDFIAGPEYARKVNAIAGEVQDLARQFREEIQFHNRSWRTRHRIYTAIFSEVDAIDHGLKRLLREDAGRQIPSSRVLTFPAIARLPSGK